MPMSEIYRCLVSIRREIKSTHRGLAGNPYGRIQLTDMQTRGLILVGSGRNDEMAISQNRRERTPMGDNLGQFGVAIAALIQVIIGVEMGHRT